MPKRAAFNTFQRSDTFSPKWSQKLLQATKEGQRPRVSACLSHHADPDVAEEDGTAALHYAVLRNSKGLVEDLLKGGADVNAVSVRLGTPLLVAILQNNLKIVRLLAGSEVMRPLDKLGTALHAIAFVANEKMLEALGSDILSSDCRLGATIDVQAYASIARRPLRPGAEPDQAVLENITPVMLAARMGNLQTLERLLELSIPPRSRSVVSAKSFRNSNGHLHQLRRTPSAVIVDGPAALRDTDSTGRTALMHAAEAGHKSSVQYLVNPGSNLNTATISGDTALSLALKGQTEKHCEVATLLIESGACCEWRDSHGDTLLHLAASNDHRHALAALIEKYPPTTSSKATKPDSLSRVIGRQCNSAVDIGDLDSTNADGQTALALAVRYDHDECVASLIEAGACVDLAQEETWPPVVQAAANGNPLILEKLLDKHADVLAQTAGGETALHKAAERGHESIADQLIRHAGREKHKLLHHTNNAKQTALHIAALHRQIALVDLLRQVGASPDLKDRNGNTLWDIANTQGDDGVRAVLRKHKARESRERFNKLVVFPKEVVRIEVVVVRRPVWSFRFF
ncbi:Ankyrin repeat domain-containing protein 50 [Pseudocercospora fuligena]|uniref:Ankyrin repeat domain-containing protein 50 n=1 Tax=Pseudocercospora fuligena TaxID=685502 RepID=A0A8H6RJL9_9PEZI|nr:Ankyrin repeat domain-containing protein 50 [Pseudocercospora fuligena]